MEEISKEPGLFAGGEVVPESGQYFIAGRGAGVFSRARRLEAGERFPRIRADWFWKSLLTDTELQAAKTWEEKSREPFRSLPKRRHKA